ncbi:site-specific integrase [Terrabacter aerolatus]|uniref:Putative prophage phiRv2 integrase n=1 Tax=Terrabacter aerolatus TaxID=422442 RepID=A0A512D4X0_9MICO|nr:site-specific integrase [Terrabacter aerolatus]GEO31513.1 putative prophage phiRv2 integrase [Terrabacter aerolatus]
MVRRRFGYVRKLPSGRFHASFQTPDGSRHNAPETYRTEADAARFLDRMQQELDRGHWQPDARLGQRTLRECCEAYLEENPRVGERWAETCRRNMRLHLEDLLDRPTATITPPVIRAWHAKALRGAGGRTSISQSYRFIRAVLNVAVQDGAIVRNPCQIPGAGAQRSAERGIATPSEVAQLIEATTPRLRAAVALAAWCGLRRGEICALRVSDVDLAAGRVTVRRNYVELLEAPRKFEKDPKSDAGKRTVTIPPHIRPLLEHHAREYSGAVYFVADRTGQQVRGNTIYQAFVRARHQVGLTIAFHDLRHTGQSLAAATGASLVDLKKRLGHSSTAAAQRYMHAVEGRDAQIADALSQLAEGGDASRLPRTF